MVEAAKLLGIEIPVFCYHHKLDPVGACRMCLVEISPGPPVAQAGCIRPVADGMVVRTQSAMAVQAQGRHPRVRARQPPARLSGLRQGRRVPAAGLHLPPRLPDQPHRRPAPALQEADPALAEHRPRPRALRALLSLHALLRRGGVGAGADRRRARRPFGDRQPVRPAAHVDLQRQHHRPLPRRRPHLARVALRVAAVGHASHARASARSARSAAT